MSEYFVYITTSKRNGTLYVGITSNLTQRVKAHKRRTASIFTKKYGVNNLVYYERHNNKQQALIREKQIKKWNRKWKLRLIEKVNPDWKDLYNEVAGSPPSRGRAGSPTTAFGDK